MPKSRTVYVNFGRALPKDEPLAGLMGRMFVIFADLLIERDELTRAIGAGNLGESEDQYRYLYFVRATSLTLHDGRELLVAFETIKTFRDWLRADPPLHEKWETAKKQVDRAAQKLEHVRNKIGAHIDKSIDKGVKSIGGATEGKLEIGADGWLRPHNLATMVLLATLSPIESTEEWFKEVNEIITKMAAVIPHLIHALQIAFALYRKRYPAIGG